MSETAEDRGWGPAGDPGSGAAANYRKKHIVAITVGGIRLNVRREAAPLFAGFITEIVKRGYDLSGRADDWGYASRYVRGYEAKRVLSNHAWGLAIDLNAQDHPLGQRGTHVPDFVVQEAHRWGLSWGGDYIHRPDEMHFEVLLTPAQVEQLVKNLTSTGRPPLPTAPPSPHSEDSLLMAIAKDDQDARRAWVREQCLTYWGQEPSVQDHDFLANEVTLKGADNVLAQIADHSRAQAFRAKRGW